MVSPKILIVDDHEVVRQGIRALLDGNFSYEICGEAVNGRDGVDAVLALKPDLVILDLSMPVMNGLEAAREIRRLAPATKIIVYSMHQSPQISKVVQEAGGDAFVSKSDSATDLPKTVKRLLRPLLANNEEQLSFFSTESGKV
jgi:two-component system, NarL family, nitrate/nitrite response regulator NarL